MATAIGLDVFVAPTPTPGYDQPNEAAYRRALELWCKRAVTAISNLNSTGGGGGGGLTSPVGVADGGTGRTSLTSGSLLVGNGVGAVNLLAPGAAGTVVRSNGASWTVASLTPADVGLSTPITVPQGGTGLTTLTSGALMVGAGTANVAFLSPGAAGTVVRSTGSAWAAAAITAADVQAGVFPTGTYGFSGGKVLIDGTDSTLASGDIGIVENAGNLRFSTRSGMEFQIDNDSNETGMFFKWGTDGSYTNLMDLADTYTLRIAPTATTGATDASIKINAGTNGGANSRDATVEFQRGGTGLWRIGVFGSITSAGPLGFYNVGTGRETWRLAATATTTTEILNNGVTTENLDCRLQLQAGTNAGANDKDSVFECLRGGTVLWRSGVIGSYTDGGFRIFDVAAGSNALNIARTTLQMTLATPLGADSGGTGRNTLTTGNLLVGAGTSPVTFLAPGVAGTVPRSNGSAWTVAQLSATDITGLGTYPAVGPVGTVLRSTGAAWVADGSPVIFGSGVTTAASDAILQLNAGTAAGANNRDSYIEFQRGGTARWREGVVGSVATDGAYRLRDLAFATTALEIANQAVKIYPVQEGALQIGNGLTTEFASGFLYLNCGTNAGANNRLAVVIYQRGGTTLWYTGIVGSVTTGTEWHLYDVVNSIATIRATPSATVPAVGLFLGVTTGNVSGALQINCGTNAGANNKDAYLEIQRGGTALWRVGLLGSSAADSRWRLYNVSGAVVPFMVDVTAPTATVTMGEFSAHNYNMKVVVNSGTNSGGNDKDASLEWQRGGTALWRAGVLGSVGTGGEWRLYDVTNSRVVLSIAGTNGQFFPTGTTASASVGYLNTTSATSAYLALNSGTNAGANNQDAAIEFQRNQISLWRMGIVGTLTTGGEWHLQDLTNSLDVLRVTASSSSATWAWFPAVTTANFTHTITLNSGTNAGANNNNAMFEFYRGGTTMWRFGIVGSVGTDTALRMYSTQFSKSAFAFLCNSVTCFLTVGEFTSENYNTVILFNAGTNAGANNKDSVIRIQRGFSNLWDYGVAGSVATDGAIRYIEKVTSGAVRLLLTLGGSLTMGTSPNTCVFTGPGDLTGTTQVIMDVIAQPSTGATVSATGFRAQINTNASAVTYAIAIALNVRDSSKGAGSTITTLYGIKVENITQGATNYALFTGTGLVSIGDTLITVASVAGKAGFRIPHGAAPSAPVNGDIWTTTAGLFARINGATVGPYT